MTGLYLQIRLAHVISIAYWHDPEGILRHLVTLGAR